MLDENEVDYSRKEKDFTKDFFERVVEIIQQEKGILTKTEIDQIMEEKKLEIKPLVPAIKPLPLEISKPVQLYSQIREMNLGRITPLILDPRIKIIVCEGAGKNIIAKDALKIEPLTMNIQLNEEEIKQVIKQFSDKTKIPLTKIFRAVFTNIGIEAISSDIIGSRFIITKL